MKLSRRTALESLLLGATATATTATAVTATTATATTVRPSETPPLPARGTEGQRKPDQGNGTYLNPIMAGDHPDPSILTM